MVTELYKCQKCGHVTKSDPSKYTTPQRRCGKCASRRMKLVDTVIDELESPLSALTGNTPKIDNSPKVDLFNEGKPTLQAEEEAEELISRHGGKLPYKEIKLAREALKEVGLDEDDPIFKLIDKGVKYLPLLVKGLQGFNDAYQAHQQRNQSPQQSRAPPTLPIGYGTPEAIKYKNDPAWQAQRDAYLEYVGTVGVMSVHGRPMGAQHAPSAPKSRNPNAVPVAEYNNLAELQRAHADNVDMATRDRNGLTAEETQAVKEHQKELIAEINKQRGVEPQAEEVVTMEEQKLKEVIGDAMISEKVEWLTGLLNEMSDAQLTKELKDPSKIFDKIGAFKFMITPYIPVLKELPAQGLQQIIIDKCPDKAKIITSLDKWTELAKAYDEFRKGL